MSTFEIFWGILVPASILTLSFLLTFKLYRHFSKELHHPKKDKTPEPEID